MWSTTVEEPEAAVGFDDVERYAASRARPAALLATRAALWAAVGVGFVGGLAGLAGWASPDEAPPAVLPTGGSVPAAVAGTAEQATIAWLTATSDDQAVVDGLFVEAPSIDRAAEERLTVGTVATVVGEELGPGYWTVTVAAEVTEPPTDRADPATDPAGGAAVGADEDDAGEDDADVDADEEVPVGPITWYLEVGIVGDAEVGLAALTAPAVLPAPPPAPDGWSVEPSAAEVDADDPVAVTVDGFLRALLTGSGDPSPYLAPGVEVPTSSSPLFTEIDIDSVRLAPVDEVTARAHVWLTATTPGGTEHRIRYQVTTALRDGRWEVTGITGAPAASHDPSAGS